MSQAMLRWRGTSSGTDCPLMCTSILIINILELVSGEHSLISMVLFMEIRFISR